MYRKYRSRYRKTGKSNHGPFFVRYPILPVIVLAFLCAVSYSQMSSLINIGETSNTTIIQETKPYNITEIGNLLLYPDSYYGKQIYIEGTYEYDQQKHFAKSLEDGYRVELYYCDKNRDLEGGKTYLFVGLFYESNKSLFECTLFDESTYWEEVNNRLEYIEQQRIEQEAQEELRLQLEEAEILIEQGRLDLEQDYKIKIAEFERGMSRSQVEDILGHDADLCEYKSGSDATQCEYSEVIDDTYRFFLYIIFDDRGFEYSTRLSVVTI